MTITYVCLASICSIAVTDVEYNLHTALTEISNMNKMLLVNIEYIMFSEATIRHRYKRDLVLLLDDSVYEVVTPTLLTVKRAVDKGVEEGKNMKECYMRTEELLETEARDLFDDKLLPCLEAFMTGVNKILQEPPRIMSNFTTMMSELDNFTTTCQETDNLAKCIQKKLDAFIAGKYMDIQRSTDELSERMESAYNATLEKVYECTNDMKTALDEMTGPALRQGLACIDTPDYADYSFSRE